MKGIVLAGGSGSRLYPLTKGVSKQLLPVYDKPMIYYPISVLMQAGIKEILIISTPQDLSSYKRLLGDGQRLGVSFQYAIQEKPEGLAQAFIIGKDFIGEEAVCLILGDNIFYGEGLTQKLQQAVKKVAQDNQAQVFGYYVKEAQRYGVLAFDQNQNPIEIIEKPKNPPSNYAVVGLYFYPNDVVKVAQNVKPSKRGELEITDVNQYFLDKKSLGVTLMGRGYAWLDTGTHESLIEASNFIQTIEKRQGLKVAALEEVAYEMGYINKDQLTNLAQEYKNNAYGQYLIERTQNGI